jgi:hypothetical protein
LVDKGELEKCESQTATGKCDRSKESDGKDCREPANALFSFAKVV